MAIDTELSELRRLIEEGNRRLALVQAQLDSPEPRYLSKTDAATFLCVSPRTLQRHVAAGIIPHIPAGDGRKLLFDRRDLDKFYQGRKVGG